MYGFYRVAAAVPEMRVADPFYNAEKIIALAARAAKESCAAVVFPELAVTGYTCGDLFHQSILLDNSYDALMEIAAATKTFNTLIVVGCPFLWKSALYNCAFVLHRGEVKGIVPKSHLPNYREFYEKRWFTSGQGIKPVVVEFQGEDVPFGTNIIFNHDRFFKLGIEICEDLWHVIPPSSFHAMAGATVIMNLSASDEIVSKSDYRLELLRQQSARCVSAYIYSSSGVHESSTDLVFGGHAVITENGATLAENQRFLRHGSLTTADIDCEKLIALRISESSFNDSRLPEKTEYFEVAIEKIPMLKNVKRYFAPHPFVPSDETLRNKRCGEIISIQAAALAKRFEHTSSEKAVIGISGGLDSTLALLVAAETFRLLGKNDKNIVTITMPGFGTSDRTFNNALKLCKYLGTDLRTIDITKSCLAHFGDIGHDAAVHDITYENVQARERTRILMDIANREKGLVIGTGDLSEAALGWSTYNGDHMSMYAVNCGVPKTLIRYLIKWVADNSDEKLAKILLDIIDTPVSPELLPKSGNGEINQKTEDIIGPYELHDFFLYHTVKYGAAPSKIKFMASQAFEDKYDVEYIEKILNIFFNRFFSNQFKRSCIPDGPKVGTISLSPRGDWRMPSDASAAGWQG
ncbi:MAG: NAD(+) synthase [Lentisphaerae bacterium GWF2_45_14]|nr:MAG: NAD(+) synthase [Lentisphaerae bacterium GWF2_45_14]